MSRNFDMEFEDNQSRSYAYDFDWIIRDYLLQRVSKNLHVTGLTLEIGAYLGDMTEQILKRFPNLSVLEGSSQLCNRLVQRFGSQINLTCATIEEVVIEEKFDTIFLVHTLEHLDEPISSLRRISSWLKDNGNLVIAVPNAEALSRQIAVKMGLIESNCSVTPGEYEHGHRRTYNMDLLQSHVRSAGLNILDSGGVIVKPLANGQFDEALKSGLVSHEYIKGCDVLAREFPTLSASIYVITQR